MAKEENLLQRIAQIGKLTRSEAKIADLFQRAYPKIVFESMASIGEKAGVSKATIVRFVQHLGYEGFADFQDNLKREVAGRLAKPIERYSLRKHLVPGKGGGQLGQHISAVVNNLHETLDRIDPEKFMKAAQMLAFCKGTLYITGHLSSYGLAQNFWHNANFLRERVVLLENEGSTLPNRLSDTKPEDVLLAITHRRYALQTRLTIEYFASIGAKLVAVTDGEMTPISHLTDVLLVAPGGGISIFDSCSAALAVLEALVATMADLLADTSYEQFDKIDKLFNYFGTF
ncbi:MAG: MurR/RpiR family transcriptional regulator [Deltaproteobacteria bacterium]|nr:MurR/RpiR family transcriptional regulator [Deltaproteobacteria bacterium]